MFLLQVLLNQFTKVCSYANHAQSTTITHGNFVLTEPLTPMSILYFLLHLNLNNKDDTYKTVCMQNKKQIPHSYKKVYIDVQKNKSSLILVIYHGY